jgi:hypothetical protein
MRMRHLFTHQNACRNKGSSWSGKLFILLLLLVSNAVTLSAHTVDYFSSCGYVCDGSTVTVNAHLSLTASNTNYNWQFRDNSGTWKCFINGSNTINGAVFTVSNATAKGQLSAAPTLTIKGATTALSNVDVRIVMADGTNVSPCGDRPTFPVYGTDKSLKLHVLTGSDCSNIAAYCSGGTPATLKLGDLIWNDINANGVKDSDEPGVPNAGIKLYADNNNDNVADGAAIATTTTNASGIYGFTKLKSGNYIVGVTIPVGYTKGPASTIDPDNNVNNDNNGVNLIGANQAGGEVRSKAITLSASGEPSTDGDDSNSNLTLDIPLCGNSQLGDFVWNDKNANGIQDLNEPGIQGATVKLTFPDGVTTRTTTTNASGKYLFTALATGNYKVTFSTPAGFNPSAANQGSNDAKDSDPIGGSVTVAVSAGTSNLTLDAGFYTKVVVVSHLTLGNQVWNDFDGDGKRDPNEPGIPGATISLYTDNDSNNIADGPAIKTAMSNTEGHYQFTNLGEGRYIASMPILPGYQQSPNTTTQATSPFPDNDVDDDNNLVTLVGINKAGQGILYTNAITLSAGDEPVDDGDGADGNNTFDLAECGNSFIGDFVWNDVNGNGIQEADEQGIDSVKVTLTFPDGRTASTYTHEYIASNNPNDPIFGGYYNFPNLGPGTYKVTFETPAGLHASPSNKGTDDAKDSDPVNGGPVTVTVTVDKSDFTIDAGFTDFTPPPPPATCPNLSVGNMVFIDLNGNGTKEMYEPGIGGLTVKLYADADGDNVADGAAISTLMTAEDGTYYFGNLAAGKYIVGVTTGSTYAQSANGNTNPDNDKDNDNNGIKTVNGEVLSNAITLSAASEPINDGSDNNSNLTLDVGLKIVAVTPPCTTHCDCKNDCTHTGCGHSNCGHNSCKNDCTHTGCGHSNCGHSSCKNDCDHKDNHPNCGHNSCKNNCAHTGCGHSNCGHSSCKNDCDHKDNHPNCGHNSCKNNCTHTGCGHSNCGHNSCKNDCDHKDNHPGCGHNSCKNDCKHTDCSHANCGHNSCKNDCKHTDCSHKTCGKKSGGNSRAANSDAQSVVAAIITPDLTNTSVSVFPNPANDYIVIKVMATKAGKGLARITDLSGKLVATKTAVINNGMNLIKFDKLGGLNAGTYFVQLDFNYHIYNQQLVVGK